MNIKSKIKQAQKQLAAEMARFEKRKKKLEAELYDLYEKDSFFKIGDRIKIASVTVRDIHRNSDIEILGKEGNVTEIDSEWITVKLDGCQSGHAFPLSSRSVEKIDKTSKYVL